MTSEIVPASIDSIATTDISPFSEEECASALVEARKLLEKIGRILDEVACILQTAKAMAYYIVIAETEEEMKNIMTKLAQTIEKKREEKRLRANTTDGEVSEKNIDDNHSDDFPDIFKLDGASSIRLSEEYFEKLMDNEIEQISERLTDSDDEVTEKEMSDDDLEELYGIFGIFILDNIVYARLTAEKRGVVEKESETGAVNEAKDESSFILADAKEEHTVVETESTP
ncbi:hypothetical protein BDQ17DRAFT_1432526 [Cyathus striatus]|nr:hypothetical protein BDQ17DRAFT_1432526 [Cyathus striatus]